MTTQVRSIYSIPSIPSVTLRQGVIRFTEIFASMMDGWVVGCCGTGLACISAVLCRRLCRSTTEPFYLLFFWFALTAAGTISALWLAAFFPAIMSPDSMSQWGQAVAWKLTDWHPIGMTLLMRAVHIAFGGLSVQGQVAVLTWLQGTAFWFSIFAMLGLANLPVRAKVLASAGVALYYPIWLYTVTLWKDVWFAIALFWMVFFGYRAFLGERTWWKSGWLLLPPLVFAVLNRYTASLSFVFLAAAISPIIWINLGKRRLVANCIFWLSMVVTALGIQKSAI